MSRNFTFACHQCRRPVTTTLKGGPGVTSSIASCNNCGTYHNVDMHDGKTVFVSKIGRWIDRTPDLIRDYNELLRELEMAEDYEECARIRDRINELKAVEAE